MTIFSQFIPLLGSFFTNFSPLVYCLALGVICGIPSIIKEVTSYV